MTAVFTAFLLAVTTVFTANAQPTVTLSHGGKLQGVSETFQDVPMDVFIGVRYAKSPVGDLRFKKPASLDPWKGTVEATTIGNRCPQMDMFGDATKYVGDEDCLFLNIIAPGGVKPGANKPVMIWIHGGSYLGGTGTAYVSGALAAAGDVIVITINYRLGVLGFLSTSKGTGNYGLWDQRAAIIWVKENIAQFGGDPELITIFGESAGGGSVSAQLISKQNDGLFKRGITQSGTIYMLPDTSENTKHKVATAIHERTNCAADVDVYECLRKLGAKEIVADLQLPAFMSPTADGDFFDDEYANKLSYKPAHRFDLMAGMNGQEGGVFYEMELKGMAAAQNISTDEGVGMEMVESYLKYKCSTQLTPFSPNLCADFIIRTYKIREAENDKERAIRLTDFLGEITFNMDTANQLEQHSTSDKSTYGYYFTNLEKIEMKNPLWVMQDWMKTKADHADELTFVFNAGKIAQEVARGGIWKDMVAADPMGEIFLSAQHEESPLAAEMVKMWTNFAISGNPNKPAALCSKIPEWPEFTPESNNFLEINSEGIKVIPTPHKERLNSLRENLVEARQLQLEADVVSDDITPTSNEDRKHNEL